MTDRNPTWLLIALLALLLFGTPAAAGFLTDLWWFETLGFERAFWVITGARWGMGVAGGVLAFLAVWLNVRTAFRNTPIGRPRLSTDLTENPLGTAIQRVGAERLGFGLSAIIGLLVGGAVSGWWYNGILAFYGQDFGYIDPIFGLDARVYTFLLPLLLDVRSTLLVLLVVCTLASSWVYLSRGAVRVQLDDVDGQFVAKGLVVLPEARRHLGSLVAAWLLMVALGIALDRFELLYAQRGVFAGPGYADIHATLPLMTVQAVLVAVAAGAAWRAVEKLSAGWGMAAAALILLPWGLVSAWPAVVQRFSVDPNELSREAPHINDHIEATRFAFHLDDIEERALAGVNTLDQAALDRNLATLHNVRLWDHEPLLATFAKVQEIRTYYEFVDVDNDRYRIDGELRQIMLSPRELPTTSLPLEARTWVNERMTYTHGYGMALGPVNEVNEQGLPKLFIQDLPPQIAKPELQIDRPEIYFGEAVETEVFVRTNNPEFDHPRGDENVYATYEGDGGVQLNGLARLFFSLRFGSTDLLFSNDITPESRVLMYRNIVDRITRLAPFLAIDDDPYMVIADGRLIWMIDAYTTTWHFPYSRNAKGLGNYLRNSVKITVDAYSGDVTFYRTHEPDPIADAWSAALPEMFVSIDEMPASLRSHVRYPETYFAIQAELYATYHMRDHQVFYNREDQWEIPKVSGSTMEPYYTVMTLPGETGEEFILMLPFNPKGKPNLAAWLVARSDGSSYGETMVYKFPKEKMVYGPDMVMGRINQTDVISEKVSLWNQQGSVVDYGTLLVIPVEESLLYVQPLYLKASTESAAIPELKRVIVAYEDDIAMAPTLEEGLAQIFGAPEPLPVPAPSPEPGSETPTAPSEPVDGTALEQAREHWARAQDAAARGDWAAWGEHIEALGAAIEGGIE